jgi:hypothetical protein
MSITSVTQTRRNSHGSLSKFGRTIRRAARRLVLAMGAATNAAAHWPDELIDPKTLRNYEDAMRVRKWHAPI